MNATAVETLERRLDATRRALIGEQERLRGAVEQAAHAADYVLQIEAGIRKSEQIIADLTAALDELRGWAPGDETETADGPTAAQIADWFEHEAGDEPPTDWRRRTATTIRREWLTGDPLDAKCPSCGAKTGELCRSPNGEPVEAHATRGAPS